MKNITMILALVTASVFAWAQTPIVEFPASLGTAEYSKVTEVPKELKDATSLYKQAEVAGYLIAQYYEAYGTSGICSFDANMNAFFPPKDWLKSSSRFVGVNDANQIIAVRNAKKGIEIALLDKQMNVVNKVPVSADVYTQNSEAKLFVADGKIYMPLWQNSKPACWVGYVLDANNLQILSQTQLSTCSRAKFVYSPNKEYVACIAVNEHRGKYLYHPLYNGASVLLYDKNFSLLKERYVYGNIDDPWVLAQDEKTRKKIYNGGMTGILTYGDYQVQLSDDGVLRYVTLDAASAHIITASSNEVKPIRSNRLAVYTLAADRNDSVSLKDVMTDKIFLRQTLINADDNNITLMAWYKEQSRQTASAGYVALSWNIQTNELATLKEEQRIFPAEGYEDYKRVLYRDESGLLVEHYRGKGQGAIYYDMWCSADGQDVRFPHFVAPGENVGFQALNNMFYLWPIQSRTFIAHSAQTEVSCFLVREWLNTGYNGIAPIENTDPLYLEFVNKEGPVATFVFPKTYEIAGFGVRSYRSTVRVAASRIDDTSICLYIQDPKAEKHQWVTLRPALLAF